MDWLPLLGIVASVLVSVVGATWYLRGQFARVDSQFTRVDSQFTRVDSQLNRINNRLDTLAAGMQAHVSLFAILFSILQRMQALAPTDLSEIVSTLGGALFQSRETVERAVASGNPITPQEGERLNRYLDRAERGDAFTPQEAYDFYLLSNKVAKERPNDPGIWPLLVLGAFMLGIYLAQRGRTTE